MTQEGTFFNITLANINAIVIKYSTNNHICHMIRCSIDERRPSTKRQFPVRAVQRSLLSPICNSLEGLDAKGVADDSVGRKSLNLCEATESRRGRLEVPGNVSGAARHNP